MSKNACACAGSIAAVATPVNLLHGIIEIKIRIIIKVFKYVSHGTFLEIVGFVM
jgi:hypothetical protein